MEKLSSIEQLKPGTKFVIFSGDKCESYEFLCIHPRTNRYILALDSYGQEGKKFYIPSLLDKSGSTEVFVGEWDDIFILNKQIEHHKKEIEHLQKRLNEKLEAAAKTLHETII